MSSGTAKLPMVTCGVLVGIALTMIGNLHGQKLVTPGYLFNSDPTCRELNNTFYLFTTQDAFTVQAERPNIFYKGMFAYHALSTTDFDHWIDHGSIVTSRDVTWDTGKALWDGDAGIPANGEFYAYAAYRMNPVSEENYGIFDIGALTADNPLGPYKDALGGPMAIPDARPLEGLSPQVVYSDDRVPYLIWGAGDTSKNWVKMARLAPDMTHLAESPREVVVPKEDKCGNLDYFESPVLFEIGKKWYFTYVAYKDHEGPGCAPKGSYIDYTVADSMFGPFDGPIHHLIYPAGDGVESIQQGVCTYKGKLFIAYHIPYDNGQLPGAKINASENGDSILDHHRQVAVTALIVLPDGSLQPIYPSRDQGVGTRGVSILTLDAFAPRREAIEFQVRMNAWDEAGVNGEYQMMMGDGGYLQYNNVDFGEGAKGFHVEISSDNPTIRNGVLEIRLDNPAGKLVGKVTVESSGGHTNYRTLTTDVTVGAEGIHNLFLVARGSAAPTQQRLFNITSFGFTRNTMPTNKIASFGFSRNQRPIDKH
jgi:arabinoxylan arabinofuranohydrolase